jgi:RNA polymerase sigma-70 factor (ECF subfamily)
MYRRRRSIMRVVPFSSLREVQQEETGIESEGPRAAPVQPAGYGMGAAQDPADLIAEREAVGRSMARLPEALRLCLLLSVVGGLSSCEIAQVLGLGEAAVRQRLSRARKRFRRLYLEESGEAIVDGSTVTPQAAGREQRVTLTARSPAALESA